MKAFFWKMLQVGGWLAAFALLATYLSPYLSPFRFRGIGVFLALGYPYILFVNILLFSFSLFFDRYKMAFFTFVVILLGYNHLTNCIAMNWSAGTAPANATTFQIMSYNVKAGYGGGNNANTKKNLHNLLQLIKKEDSNIVCFQEFPNKQYPVGKEVLAFIKDDLGIKNMYSPGRGGTTIISQHPIIDKGYLSFKKDKVFRNAGNACIWADIQITPNKIVRVYSIHFQSLRISLVIKELADEGKDAVSKEYKEQYKFIYSQIRAADRARYHQIKKVKAHMEQSPYPIILCGDFNDVPYSYNHQIITKDLQDSFQEKGFGIGGTYAEYIPALRIDYILADKKLTILNHQTIKKAYSDHYPIVSELAF